MYVFNWPIQVWWSRGYVCNSCYPAKTINLSHCCPIFHGCVSEVVALSSFVTSYISQGNQGFILITTLQCYAVSKKLSTFWPRSCFHLFAHYVISLSLLFKLTLRHWTYKMMAKCVLSSVHLTLSQFVQSSFMQYIKQHVSSSPISLMMIVTIHVFIIIIRSEVWIITYCFGLGLETIMFMLWYLAMFLCSYWLPKQIGRKFISTIPNLETYSNLKQLI